MNHDELEQLFVEHIRDLYDAEKQLVKALPKMAKAAESEELAEAIRTHLEQTQGHVSRLEDVFRLVGVAAKGKACKGMKGLLEEGTEAVQEHDEGVLRDLAIIAGAQKVEHYEISAYGTARAIAEALGLDKAIKLLQQTETEETQTDANLTNIAKTLYQASDEEEDEGVEEEEEDTEEVEVAQAAGGRSRRAAPAKATKSRR